MSERVMYRPLPLIREWERRAFEHRNRCLVDSVGPTRIAVILHLFYDEAWPEIKEYLKNLKRWYEYDLFVTITCGRIFRQTLEDIRSFKPGCIVLECPNRGFDVGPFFKVANLINPDEYDVVFKLHSKGTKRPLQYIYGQLFLRRTWFLDLYEGVLSNRNVCKVVAGLRSAHCRAIAAAENLIICDPPEKQDIHIGIAKRLHLDLGADYRYVAGTCFAMSSEQFAFIKSLDVSMDDFEPTNPAAVADHAHFLERFMCQMGEDGVWIGMPRRAPLHFPRRAVDKAMGPVYLTLRAIRDAVRGR